jgi:hypothetical protein
MLMAGLDGDCHPLIRANLKSTTLLIAQNCYDPEISNTISPLGGRA